MNAILTDLSYVFVPDHENVPQPINTLLISSQAWHCHFTFPDSQGLELSGGLEYLNNLVSFAHLPSDLDYETQGQTKTVITVKCCVTR